MPPRRWLAPEEFALYFGGLRPTTPHTTCAPTHLLTCAPCCPEKDLSLVSQFVTHFWTSCLRGSNTYLRGVFATHPLESNTYLRASLHSICAPACTLHARQSILHFSLVGGVGACPQKDTLTRISIRHPFLNSSPISQFITHFLNTIQQTCAII